MPYYERTGMISHRHPFYGYGASDSWLTTSGYRVRATRSRPYIPGRFHGYGQNPFQTPGPWAPEDEQPDGGSPLPAPPLDQQYPAPTPVPAKAGVPLVPLLILGGAVAIFVLTLKKKG